MKDENKEKRVKCPFCSERILVSAKKCKHCGEWIHRKEQKVSKGFLHSPITPKTASIAWWTTMLVFLSLMYGFGFGAGEPPDWVLAVVISAVMIGGFAFVAVLITVLNMFTIKGKRFLGLKYLAMTGVVFVAFFAIMMKYENISAKNGQKLSEGVEEIKCPEGQNLCVLDGGATKTCMAIDECEKQIGDATEKARQVFKEKNSENSPKQSSNVATTNQNANQIECIGPDGKHFNTSMDECKNLNEKWGKPVDYMTNCNIHPDCGGGTERMPKSQCDMPCSGNSINSTTSAPSNQQTTPTSKLNFYCYDNAYGYSYYTSSGEKCNLNNLKSTCEKRAKDVTYDPCMDKCLSEANERSAFCIYNLSDPEESLCRDENMNIYQECMDACGEEYEKRLIECN